MVWYCQQLFHKGHTQAIINCRETVQAKSENKNQYLRPRVWFKLLREGGA